MHTLSSSTAGDKALIRQFVDEVVNRNRLDLIGHLVADEYVFHCPDGDLYGPDGARLNLTELRAAFPDLHIDLAELLGEGDLVAHRFVLQGTQQESFLGLPPSNAPIALPGMRIDRIADGRLVESWITFNVLALVRANERNPR